MLPLELKVQRTLSIPLELAPCVSTNINHKGLHRTANEYAEERGIYKDLISKNINVDILNSASRILQC